MKIGDESNSAYRISVVEELKTSGKFYHFGNNMINRSCTVNHASSAKTFTFDYLSNSKFNEMEHAEWISKCRENKYAIPSKKFANQRAAQLKQMIEAGITDSLINDILKRKAMFCLDTRKRDSHEAGNSHAEEREKPKKPKSTISYMSFAKTSQEPSKDSSFDPFSRRKCRPSQMQAFNDTQTSSTQTAAEARHADSDKSNSDEKSAPRNMHESINLDI